MSSSEQREALKIISELLEDPYNQICADCQCQPSKWASTTLGVFICIDCSGVHRSLGTHISFVRSCTLDTWMLDQARLMKAIGNRLGNSYWEAKLPKDFQRPGNSNRSLMQAFIKDKYQIKKWADAGPPPHVVYKHLLMKQLSISNQNADGTQKKSKNTRHSGSHRHSSRHSSSRHSEKNRNSNPAAEPPKPATPVTPVQQPQDDFKMPLDDFFAEQPRRTIPKPYIPHKKVVYEIPKEEPDYENMNSDEIDKFFIKNESKQDYFDEDNNNNNDQNSENENGRNRSNSLEEAMMQRIQNILNEERPKKSLNRNKSQIEYDDSYEDNEEEDIFGDSAVAVRIPFGQYPSKSDPQISSASQAYESFGDEKPPNTASLQSFFNKTSNNNKDQANSNLTTNLSSSATNETSNLYSDMNLNTNSYANSNLTNIPSYSNSNISSNETSKPVQIDSDDDNEDNQHRHQDVKTKKQKSVVLNKMSRLDILKEKEKEISSPSSTESIEANINENGENQNNQQVPIEQQQEDESNNIAAETSSFLPSIDNINLDISPDFGTGNDGGGFWDDDAKDDDNNLDDGFFDLPPNSKISKIELEGKALSNAHINSPMQSHQEAEENTNISPFPIGAIDTYETQKEKYNDISQYEAVEGEKEETPVILPQVDKEEAANAINDYNPFGSENQGTQSDILLTTLLNNQGKSEARQEYANQDNNYKVETQLEEEEIADLQQPQNDADEIDLNALADEIGDEDIDHITKEETEIEAKPSQSDQQEPQTLQTQENSDNNNQLQEEEEEEEQQQPPQISEKDEHPLYQPPPQNQETNNIINNQQTQEDNQQQQQPIQTSEKVEQQQTQESSPQPAQQDATQQPLSYLSRPAKLSISMVSAMDLKPPGFTAEDELMDDFFAEAEAAIAAPKTFQDQQQPHHAHRSHRRSNDEDEDTVGFNDDERQPKQRRKRETSQTPSDVAVSRAQKSSFAPPPARKPGAHIPARLQKKMEPPPSEKETRRKRHHHSKK